MPSDDAESAELSPPTQRVVSVLELLAAAPHPQTSAQIADSLALSRSTVGNVLSALRARAWVNRRTDLTYEIGPGLLRVAERQQSKLAGGDPLRTALHALANEVGCGVALIRVDRDEIRFVAVVENRGRIPAGISVGTRLPLIPPGAATVVAHSPDAVRRAWLAAADPGERAHYEQVLADVRTLGAAVWGVDTNSLATLDVLADVVEHLADDTASSALRERILALLGGISGNAYSTGELAREAALPISYLSAPVLDPSGDPVAELLIGPLRTAVPKPERDHYLAALTATARTLHHHL